MPDWIAVILLGLIEGLTEFLPVSSTGHLLIAEQWLHPAVAETDLFNVVIQCGAVAAALAVFSRRATQLLTGARSPENREYLSCLAVAFAITVVGGLVLKKGLHWKLPHALLPVAIATVVGALVIFAIERSVHGRPGSSRLTLAVGVVVGIAQLIAAAFPGTSRSGACILFALMIGLSRPLATEFSFLLGIPTMFAASALEIVTSLKHGDRLTSHDWGLVLLGSVVAAISAFLVVRWLLRFVQTRTFVVFGWYRLALGVVLFGLLWKGGAH
jgi:undecaprenyl-diphosphatase